ncbi:MAG: CDP-alcohol phosphatidyltransferase family protein [Flavobacteriales bacterium]|nr:CDP-alcohol phosphatidyltransferase family protein [Flavobacteriales bacterium]
MKKLPIILIYSRVLLGIIIALIAFSNPENSGYTIVSLLLLGILTNVFDGVIARKLKVDTERTRTLDSNVDMFFWGISLISIFVINMEFVIQNLVLILIVVSYTKFKKTIATHTCLAKALYSLAFKDITNDQTKGNRINNLKQ